MVCFVSKRQKHYLCAFILNGPFQHYVISYNQKKKKEAHYSKPRGTGSSLIPWKSPLNGNLNLCSYISFIQIIPFVKYISWGENFNLIVVLTFNQLVVSKKWRNSEHKNNENTTGEAPIILLFLQNDVADVVATWNLVWGNLLVVLPSI